MKKYIFLLIGNIILLGGVFLYFQFFQEPIIEIKTETVKVNHPDFAYSLYQSANKERKSYLLWNPCLSEQATKRAQQIIDTGVFSHTDANGEKPFKKMIDNCIKYTHGGENLSLDYSDFQQAHQAFMNSPTHKANILGDYTQMGVGCVENTCVEFFAK